MRDHLGVGLGGEHAARRQQALLERHVVLDDPVDDHVHAVAAVVVRVGVLLAHPPVRRPAGVADAGRRRARTATATAAPRLRDPRPAPRPRVELGLQRVEVADGAHRLDPVLADHRDPRRVIAAVLELLQPGEQQLTGRAPADVADDAAHRSRRYQRPCGALTARAIRPRCSAQLAARRAPPARADLLGLLVGRRLDHHPHERLGAARAHEHAPAARRAPRPRRSPPRRPAAPAPARRGRARAR